MPKLFLDGLQLIGAVASPIAALLVSLDLGRRWTGFVMVIFVISSLALIALGFFSPNATAIGWQNVLLLAINGVGVWRYLIVPSAKER